MERGDIALWFAVVAFSIAGLAVFKLGAATKAGELVPGYRAAAAFL